MSIALSAVVRPSRLLRQALLLYGGVHAAMALWLGSGASAPLAGRVLAVAVCAIAAGAAWWRACQNGTAWRLDVSGTGAVSATVQQGVAGSAHIPAPLQLLPGSTLWPQLLCLHLKDTNGRRITVLVAPDSVSADGFRALAVACRSIAGRDNIFFEKNKIV